MYNLPAHQDKANGCELPEELRRYYLDAMGIQVWQDMDAKPVPVADNLVEGDNKKPLIKTDQPADISNSSWSELQVMVQHCDRCELQKIRTQTVFGTGNQNANLLVIGEAPGQDEDAQGEPFVGRAGQLLTAMLRAIDLQREEVYIANILKCCPPGNRDPLPVEIDSCNIYLRRQIELLKPKVIFAVGRIASQALLDSKESISALRNSQHSYEGIPLIASYHPAYLLRKPSEKRKAWHDLLQVKRLLAG